MLLQRVITAVVLLIIVIGALLISPLAFYRCCRRRDRMLFLGVAAPVPLELRACRSLWGISRLFLLLH